MFGNKKLEAALVSLEKRVRALETRPSVIREIVPRKKSTRVFMSRFERMTLRNDIVDLLYDRKLSIRQLSVVLKKDYKTIANQVRELLLAKRITQDQIAYKHHGRNSSNFKALPPKAEIVFVEKKDGGLDE